MASPPVMHVESSTNPTILILTDVLLSVDTKNIPCAFCSCAVIECDAANKSQNYWAVSTALAGAMDGKLSTVSI